MNKIKVVLCCFFTSLILVKSSLAQDTRFTGTWLGTLKLGVEVRIVFHINSNGKAGYISTADSPDQSAFGIKCDTTIINNNEVIIGMKGLMASFKGSMINDSTISGEFKQTASVPLTLKKVEKITEPKRPQTPHPPFPYKSENVSYYNSDHTIKYGSTITIPDGKGPFPALVLITGSGPQDRDETIFGHKLFAVLADLLTRNGFVVLRTDDRGIGETTGNFSTATSADFASDATNELDYLLSRPEVNKKKTGLMGHSEGGMIAPMIASTRKDVAFVILLAGPGVKIVDLMAAQNAAIAKSNGVSESAVKEIIPLFTKTVTALLNSPDTASAHKAAIFFTEEWASKQPANILSEFNFETAASRASYINGMLKEFNTPWYSYFMAFDPTPYLEKLNCKVLAINGTKDIQVISSQNLPGIQAALKKNKNKHSDIIEIPGLNHLFQECQECTVDEYGKLEQTVSLKVLDIIRDWLIKNVK